MKSRDFCYWLQGFIELTGDVGPKETWHPNPMQWAAIKNHLALVFKHEIDPEAGDQKMQDALNALHNKPPSKPVHNPGPPNDFMVRC